MKSDVDSLIRRQNDELTRTLDRKIEEAQQEKRAALAQAKKRVRELDRHITALRESRKRVRPNGGGRRPVSIDSAKVAGPGAINAVAEYLSGAQRASQKEITDATGKNSGTITHALRAHEAQGNVRWTGEAVRGSRVFEWTGKEIKGDGPAG